MSAPVDQYEPFEFDVIPDSDMLAALLELAAAPTLRVACNAWRVTVTGDVLEDLGPWWQPAGAQIRHDAAAELPGRLTAMMARVLTWGGLDALVAPRLLLSAPGVDGGRWRAFDEGIYVCTTPALPDMDRAGSVAVTGYDLTYLLDDEPDDSMSWAGGDLYRHVLHDCFVAAGLLPELGSIADIADVPHDWAAKVLPAPVSYALGDGATLLQIANQALSASGCRPLHTDRRGRWQVVPLDASTAPAWTWASGPADGYTPAHWPASKIVHRSKVSYAGDVFGVPNRLRYVQSGLDFDPTEGSGMFTYDNLTIPPADQTTLGGRVRRRTTSLPASGQDDLEKQAKADIKTTLSAAEQVQLVTIPWPLSWHYDQFQHVSPAYPGEPARMLEERTWTLPLDGKGGMQHQAYAVVNL